MINTYSYMTLMDYFWMPSVLKLVVLAFSVGFVLGSVYMWIFGNKFTIVVGSETKAEDIHN